jgi:hypothetical protein
MAVTEGEAKEIFTKALGAHPCAMRLFTFKSADDCFKRTKIRVGGPAFYSAGVVYVILDQATYIKLILFLTHEIGHQTIDPGNIVASYIAYRLYWKKSRGHIKVEPGVMSGASNSYSDIVVNTVNWRDPAFNAVFTPRAMTEAFEEFYHMTGYSGELIKGVIATMRANLIRGFMALEYLRQTNPTAHAGVLTAMRAEPLLLKFHGQMMHLVDEKNLAIRNIQGYYDVAVPIFETMDELAKKWGFTDERQWGGGV